MGEKVNDIFGVSDVKDQPGGLLRALFAEWLGTLFLVFFGCGAAVAGSRTIDERTVPSTDSRQPVLTSAFITQVALTFGLVVAAVVQAIGHISGGHVNPAITIGVMVAGQMSLIRGMLYMVAQYLGGLFGALLIWAITHDASIPDSLGANGLQFGVSPGQGFLVEFMVSVLLVLVVFGCCDSRRDDIKGSVPLAIGLTVAVCHLVSIGFTGAGMNPARTLGPLIIRGIYTPASDWIYFVGPYAGGVVAALIYTFAFKAKNNSESL